MPEAYSKAVKTFAERIKIWRESEGLSQTEAGERVGASQSDWSKWESGTVPTKVARHAVEREMEKKG